ncbi:hypothetical protein ANCCEY_02185 [Ancylostoma ceylanicum]|uniref:Uncharacterized protein n=1 Tax=Ancylostoma ceylanicum TaxID=53326 RepID=A0A0D6M890_9BILA|nr:hypothetical protein ANCCEY_02185 [Ancylostoma ceylanicum]
MTVAPERKSMPMPPLRLNIPKPSEVPSDVYEIPSDDIPFTYMRPGKKGKKSITVPPERSSTPIPLEGNSMPTPTVQHDAPMPLEQPTQQGVSEETASAFVHAGKKGTKSMVVPPERISMPVPPRGLNIPKRSEVSAELYEELCEEVPFKLASPFKKGKSMTVPPERSSTPMPTEGNSMPMPRGQLDAPPPLEPTTEEEYGDGAYVRAGKGGTNFVPIPPERNFMPIPTEGNSMAMSSDGNSMPMHPVQPNAPMQLEPPTDVSEGHSMDVQTTNVTPVLYHITGYASAAEERFR